MIKTATKKEIIVKCLQYVKENLPSYAELSVCMSFNEIRFLHIFKD